MQQPIQASYNRNNDSGMIQTIFIKERKSFKLLVTHTSDGRQQLLLTNLHKFLQMKWPNAVNASQLQYRFQWTTP